MNVLKKNWTGIDIMVEYKDEDIKKIIEVLKDHEDNISDGFSYYANWQGEEHELTEIAKDIIVALRG